MSDDLVKRWDEYVESMGSVMGEVEHMAQQMRDRIEALTADRENRLADLRIIKAERDRLREALAALVLNIDAGGATLAAMQDARAALKGETP